MRPTIEEMLAGDPKQAPRDIGTLLELLIELMSATGAKLGNAGPREYLSQLPRRGRVTKLVAQLLTE